jgi:hypothetical protein
MPQYFSLGRKFKKDNPKKFKFQPFFRITPYILGIFLGYILRTRRGILGEYLTETQVNIGWFASFGVFLATVFGPLHMSYSDYTLKPLDGALFTSLGPLGWSWWNIWTILACESGYESNFYDGFLNQF